MRAEIRSPIGDGTAGKAKDVSRSRWDTSEAGTFAAGGEAALAARAVHPTQARHPNFVIELMIGPNCY